MVTSHIFLNLIKVVTGHIFLNLIEVITGCIFPYLIQGDHWSHILKHWDISTDIIKWHKNIAKARAKRDTFCEVPNVYSTSLLNNVYLT